MMNRFLAAALVAASVSVQAAPPTDELAGKLTRVLGGKPPQSVAETPVEGLYEVVIGGRLLYVSADGNYVLNGSLFDVNTGVDLSEARRSAIRVETLSKVNDEEVILFAPEDPKYTITVFTDIDCGYCRKLHAEMGQYNDLGIAVRYLMFPRSGPRSPSWNKAVSVMCADNPQEALTRAKQGETPESATCDNPLEAHYALGQELGVRGTPAIFLENGESLPGYVPPAKLIKTLESKY